MNERAKILIVDDEPFNVDYLEQELEDLDYDTLSASNGQQALDQVQAHLPDLVLLDIMMPIMDGFEVLSRLKASPATRDIPVIIISANNDLPSVVKGIKQGAEDYLPKPFEPVLLHARIDASLLKKRFRDQELEYLHQVEQLTTAARAIEESNYEAGMIENVAARADALGELARVFRQMEQEIRAREQRLKRQLQQLQLDIEEKQQAITETVDVYIPIDRRHALARQLTLPEYTRGAALFADVSGFTALTESLANELGLQRGAEEIIRQLNRVFSSLVDVVHRYAGCVITFSGDAITCWFDDQGPIGAANSLGPAERAIACALAMQAAMQPFATIATPAGSSISLAIKIAVAVGPARRFVVGDPARHLIDVLAGHLLTVLAEAEHAAQRGEIILAAAGCPGIEEKFIVSEWRDDRTLAVVTGLMRDVSESPWPALPAKAISDEAARPWMPPAVFEKVRAGKSDLLSELRPAAALFLKFSGLDYDTQADASAKLDAFVRWVDQTIAPYEAALIQLIVGDKGNYCYIVFGAPVSHTDDAARAVSAALDLAVLPESLAYITDVQIGLAYGQMRVGTYGSSTQRTYGAIGDRTNLAARLMQAAETLTGVAPDGSRASILCDEKIYAATHSQFEYEALPPIKVKGKTQPAAIYWPVRKLRQGDVTGTNLLDRTVERVLQIDRLSPAEQLTLKVASVIGQIFSLEALSAIYPEAAERGNLARHLQALADNDLIIQRATAAATYSFKDPLTHQTAYTLMLFAQRRQLHRALAEWLEQVSSEPRPFAELAHHWQAADDLAKAIHYLEKAGEHARELGDYEEASRFLSESLALSA